MTCAILVPFFHLPGNRMKLPVSKKCSSLALPLLLAAALSGCSPLYSSPPVPPPIIAMPQGDPLSDLLGKAPAGAERPLERMGYSIQVGAFANIDNAVRLERLLNDRGIDAYYFRHESGLYKVRFGNHTVYRAAREEAERLRAQGLIDVFFIVAPEDYLPARVRVEGEEGLREELVRTAFRFLGVPYRWGGTDTENGFDCSGLTMVCYRLNGLNLPRVSGSQFQAGRLVPKEELRKGDLVFFATNGGDRVSHVGMYIGEGKFIHAPRTGHAVRVEQLSAPFYNRSFLGGRRYF